MGHFIMYRKVSHKETEYSNNVIEAVFSLRIEYIPKIDLVSATRI